MTSLPKPDQFDHDQALGQDLDSSAWMLIAANLVPLLGVLFWDWSVFEVVTLYWLENVIIGFINILKMMTCSLDPPSLDLESLWRERTGGRGEVPAKEKRQLDQARSMLEITGGRLPGGIKFFLIPFFTVHYGLFCLVHGVFVVVLLGGGLSGSVMIEGTSDPADLFSHAARIITGGFWAALALLVSHLYSFATNYLGKGEYRRTAVPVLMIAPYGRIVVLHVSILFGAFAVMALGSSLFLLVLLIAGKIVLDLKLHFRSHRKLRDRTPDGRADRGS